MRENIRHIDTLLEQRVGPKGYEHGWVKVGFEPGAKQVNPPRYSKANPALRPPAAFAEHLRKLIAELEGGEPRSVRSSVQRIESLLVPEARYDISPLGTGKNWVTEVGGLPTMVRAIAHALIRSGHSESSAIATAIAALKRWAAGGGKVHPSTRARAAAALAEWEAKKLAAHATPNKRAQAEAILERRYNPSQARTPAGGPGGGQWAEQQKALGGKGKAPKQNKDVKAYLKAQQAAGKASEAQASYDAMVAQARLTLSGGRSVEAILERRVGPHGYSHGWIKVGGGSTGTLKAHMLQHHGFGVEELQGMSHDEAARLHEKDHSGGSMEVNKFGTSTSRGVLHARLHQAAGHKIGMPHD